MEIIDTLLQCTFLFQTKQDLKIARWAHLLRIDVLFFFYFYFFIMNLLKTLFCFQIVLHSFRYSCAECN